MTEAEAKTKWCPFVQTRYAGNNGGGVAFSNRVHPFDITQNCIGSQCMAWRSHPPAESWSVTRAGKTEEWFWNPAGVRGYEDCTVHGRIAHEVTGYCGLAGK